MKLSPFPRGRFGNIPSVTGDGRAPLFAGPSSMPGHMIVYKGHVRLSEWQQELFRGVPFRVLLEWPIYCGITSLLLWHLSFITFRTHVSTSVGGLEVRVYT